MATDHAEHVWPCTRFHATSTEYDVCTCPVEPWERQGLYRALREFGGVEQDGVTFAAVAVMDKLTRRLLQLQHAYGQLLAYADGVLEERNTAERAMGQHRGD